MATVCLLLGVLLIEPSTQCHADASSLVNIDSYPLNDMVSETMINIMNNAHAEFTANGITIIENFIKPNIAKYLATEVLKQEDVMWASEAIHTIYQNDHDDPQYDDEHPRNRKMYTKCLCLPYDDIPLNASIRNIYNWNSMTSFVSGIVNNGTKKLYLFDDPLGALTINVLKNNDSIEWHFDQAQFVVILLLQNSDLGGSYEVAPEILFGNGTIAFELHNNVIDGHEPNVIKHRPNAGTLIVHQGTHSLHRVAKVYGETPRVSALLSYAHQPGQALAPDVRMTYYGRTDVRSQQCTAKKKEDKKFF